MALLTVGHGARSLDELAAIVGSAGAGVVVDVRRHPGSRRSPHLSRPSLVVELPARGVAYEWQGAVLGGRRRGGDASRHPAWREPSFRAYADHMDTPAFRAALEALVERAAGGGAGVVAMCAETLWWRCHRRLIADAAVLRGVPVVHLLGPGRHDPHRLSPAARADGDGWPVYDVGCDVGMI